MPYQAGTTAQRIRIGLTGLAFAFIVVLLGSAVTRSSREGTQNTVQPANSGQPSEPLAQLGVAPGPNDDTSNNSVAKAK